MESGIYSVGSRKFFPPTEYTGHKSGVYSESPAYRRTRDIASINVLRYAGASWIFPLLIEICLMEVLQLSLLTAIYSPTTDKVSGYTTEYMLAVEYILELTAIVLI